MFKTVTLLALAATSASPALAQQQMQGMDHSKMQGMNHDNMPGMNTPFMPAEMAMHEKMMKAKGANASETWVRKMIEHHRGAIAMSQIVLRESPDAKTRQMAQKSIAEQNKSIGEPPGDAPVDGQASSVISLVPPAPSEETGGTTKEIFP